MSASPNVPYRLEFSVEVPGTPEQVWQAIATAKGMSAWFLPTEMEEREGGSLHFSMGPEMGSDGRVTGWDPPRGTTHPPSTSVPSMCCRKYGRDDGAFSAGVPSITKEP